MTICIIIGSVIYSDEWRAYSGIPAIVGKNYTHHTVNHSQNFVDPVTGMMYNNNVMIIVYSA